MRQVTIQQADSKAEELTVLKANLHTHTTNSDGTFSPSEVIGFYADAGYDVLAFTDHRTTNRVSEYDAEGMTLLSGITSKVTNVIRIPDPNTIKPLLR